MDTLVQMELWDDINGNCPIVDFLDSIPKEHLDRIRRKNERNETRTYRQFMSQGDNFIETIDNSTDCTLYEVKYKGKGGYNYRAIAFRWGDDFVFLHMFHGSGGNGTVNKYIPLSISRVESWKKYRPLK